MPRHLFKTLLLILAVSCTQVWAQAVPGRSALGLSTGLFEGDATYDSGSLSGLQYRYGLTSFMSVEASLNLVVTNRTDRIDPVVTEATDTFLYLTSVSALIFVSENKVHPYLRVGVGSVTDEETYALGTFGVGTGYALNERISLSLEGQAWLSENAPSTDRFQHFSLNFGWTYEWGGNLDIDDDGVENYVDQCRSAAEDKDGFEDTNGCPDPDNDKDGIKDDDDKCPLEAEDKDDVEDDDGCPDVDDEKATEAKSDSPDDAAQPTTKPSTDVEKTDGAQEDGENSADDAES